ncbi:MAG: tetratricopeptide repeat protein [Deltaproteobacteria bacterium]|nr:tetratricopeptide repeat protein [Deltaproteobacteria bacterium]
MDEKSKIIDKAQKLVQKGYLDKAIAEYKRVVEKDPKDATIRLRIGDLYVKVNKKDEAIKEYGEVAKMHTQKGFYLKAIAVYKQILKLDEGQMEIHFKLADLYAKQKLNADAVASLSVLVSFYEKKNKVDEAIDVIKKMVTVDPQNIGVRLKLADYYKQKGFTNDALAEYGVAFNSLLKDSKLDKAEKIYKELYPAQRRNVSIVEGLAELYRLKGDNGQLIRYYKELADLYKEKGEVEKRKEAYEKILAISPGDNDALNALGRKVAAPEPAKEAAPSKTLSEERTAKEPLVAWPEFTKDLFEEPEAKPQEPAAPSKPKEEPLISWNEMIEVAPEAEKRPAAKPVEAPVAAKPQEAAPSRPEEAPLIEMPEIQAAEIEEEPPLIAMPEIQAAKAEEEAPLLEIQEPVPSEKGAHPEAVTEEITPEYLEPVEELPSAEEAKVIEAVKEPAPKHGLEGLEGLLPEGATVVGVMETPHEEGYIDLSSELGLEEALDFLTESWAPDEKGKETFTEFKHGVERQLSKEDSETHYNLGIAYMEMELYDDAMREFKIALKDPVFEFDCYTRLGLSLVAKGDYQEAVSQYLKGLKVSGRTDEERKGLMYELGLAYEASGREDEALEVFKSIYDIDRGFREVSSKIKELTNTSKKENEAEAIPLTDDMLEVELL